MHLYGIRVFEQQQKAARSVRGQAGNRLRAIAAVVLTLASGVPSGFAQQTVQEKAGAKAASDLPVAPAPVLTQPLDLRATKRDYSKPPGPLLGNPVKPYLATNIPKASFTNSLRLTDLVKNGKIYLSLSDALALALENNYDIAISRYYMDLADLDILRAKAGSSLFGSGAVVNSYTQGGYVSTASAGGGPGASTGGTASGTAGLTLTASGAGAAPADLDPVVSGTVQFERASSPQANTLFSGGKSSLTTNTNEYNFSYAQGFITGANLTASITNSRITTDNPYSSYSPELSSTFSAKLTQPLLNGAGIFMNKRYVYQAINNRRITDSTFRQQILYTVNQVENIYWGLVNAYEDVQAKERALEQTSKVAADNRKQLEIGTMAPLDVVNADQSVAADKQALISSQSTLNYQQQIIKQAIARNLNDPALVAAAVIPTDRVSLDQLPEESQPVEELVQEAFRQSPALEQAALTLKNDEISLKGAKNALLPTVNAYGFYNSSALGGSQNPDVENFLGSGTVAPGTYPGSGYGTVLQNLFNSSAPDKGIGFNISIPIRNRPAQAQQEQALIEYRQAELRLEQLYTQIRISVVNSMYALTNDRAQVQASIAARDYAQQSMDAEEKKLSLGASTTALVLQQQRNLASAENTLIQANATYAKDRAGLYQILASTLKHYGIDLGDAASGDVKAAPVVPGIVPAKPGNEPTTAPPATR